MAQMNFHTTPDFEEALARFMRLRGISTKSEAVRVAVREGLERALSDTGCADFHDLVGLATRAPLAPEPRFSSHDALWE